MLKPLLGTLLAVSVVATASARPELNAFINRPANTVPELITQLRSDPVVMDRFMRHFGMTRSEVLTYVRSLRLGTIKTSGYYDIYSVPEGGRIKVHQSYFKAGTPAFVNAAGDPILRIKCGNPFVAGRLVASVPTPAPSVEDAQVFKPLADLDTMVVPTAPELTALIPPPSIEELPIASLPVPTLPTQPSFNPSGQIIPAILAPIAALGAVASFGGAGGNRPTPVPEPATFLVLGAGAALAARRRKRK